MLYRITVVREPKQDDSGQMVVPILKDIRIGDV